MSEEDGHVVDQDDDPVAAESAYFAEDATVEPDHGESFFRRWIEEILVGLVVVLIVCVTVLFVFIGDIKNEQANSKERGYQNRAEVCRVEHALGLDLAPSCLEPNVVHYFNPNEPSPGATFRPDAVRLLCNLAAVSGLSDPSCPTPESKDSPQH